MLGPAGTMGYYPTSVCRAPGNTANEGGRRSWFESPLICPDRCRASRRTGCRLHHGTSSGIDRNLRHRSTKHGAAHSGNRHQDVPGRDRSEHCPPRPFARARPAVDRTWPRPLRRLRLYSAPRQYGFPGRHFGTRPLRVCSHCHPSSFHRRCGVLGASPEGIAHRLGRGPEDRVAAPVVPSESFIRLRTHRRVPTHGQPNTRKAIPGG